MIDLLRWLLVLEVLGLAFLPLTNWLCASLPDGGYGAAKIVGMLAVTYGAWLIGSFIPVASSAILPLAILCVGAALGWWFTAERTIASLRDSFRVIVAEEVIFLAALIGWSLLRAYVIHPGIAHTEQAMDMLMLNASFHAGSYPAYDPWMSGHTLNYYYLGYLMYATVAKLGGVAPTVAYNLALSTVPAMVMSAAYGVAYAFTRRLAWSLLAPVFVAVIGDWHGALVQLPNGMTPSSTSGWFFESTRVIGGSNNITEFPFFSVLLGDLHPHVMALPVTLLAITIGCAFLYSSEKLAVVWRPLPVARLLCAAVIVGSLFATNSWDYPTYLALVAGCFAVNCYLTDDSTGWWKSALGTAAVLGVASIVVFAPFYAHYASVTHGIGFVNTPSDFWQFMQVLGFFVILAAVFVASLGVLLQPADESEEELDLPTSNVASEAGQVQAWAGSNIWLIVTLGAIAVLGFRFHLFVLIVLLAIGVGALHLLYRVLNTEEPNRADAATLVLIAAGCAAAAIPEAVYLRDVFDGGPNYRMNTVFKFDYQAWVLLGVAAAYGVYRSWLILRSQFAPILGGAVIAIAAIGTILGGIYTWDAPHSMYAGGSANSLDALASLQVSDPGDYAMVRWLDVHAAPNTVEVEAIGKGTKFDEYNYSPPFGRIAYYTGLSAVMGWEGHEVQWRGPIPEISSRVSDVTTIYSTTDPAGAKALLKKYHVGYVIVGATERYVYGDQPAALAKFANFMKPAFQKTYLLAGQKMTDTIYTW